jgi:hypothetical protein
MNNKFNACDDNKFKKYSSKPYLTNDFCKFIPLFDLDINKKQNIFSACFFDMKKKSYKEFKRYMNGIVDLHNFIYKYFNDFKLRLFIDDTIYSNKKIFNKLTNIKNIQIILFLCNNFFNKKKCMHYGTFGTMVRFFPMFDFENNDAQTVIISDIDDNMDKLIRNHEKNRQVSSFYKKYYKKFHKNDIHLIYFKDLSRIKTRIISLIDHPINFLNNNIPDGHILANNIIIFKSINKKFIINFLNKTSKNILSKDELIKMNIYINSEKVNQESKYFFGIDEIFVNYFLINLIESDNKYNYAYVYNFDIFYYFYFFNNFEISMEKIKYNKLKIKIFKTAKKILKNIFDAVNIKLNKKKVMNVSYNEMFHNINGMVFDKKNCEMRNFIIKLMYKFFCDAKLGNNKYYLFDAIDLYLSKQLFGVYDLLRIKIINNKKKKDETIDIKKKLIKITLNSKCKKLLVNNKYL